MKANEMHYSTREIQMKTLNIFLSHYLLNTKGTRSSVGVC